MAPAEIMLAPSHLRSEPAVKWHAHGRKVTLSFPVCLVFSALNGGSRTEGWLRRSAKNSQRPTIFFAQPSGDRAKRDGSYGDVQSPQRGQVQVADKSPRFYGTTVTQHSVALARCRRHRQNSILAQ